MIKDLSGQDEIICGQMTIIVIPLLTISLKKFYTKINPSKQRKPNSSSCDACLSPRPAKHEQQQYKDLLFAVLSLIVDLTHS